MPTTIELVISGSAVAISLAALGFSIYQGRIARKHNRLSVKPVLDYYLGAVDDGSDFQLTLKNNGLGPALISSFALFTKGYSMKELSEEHNIENLEQLSAYIGFPHNLNWTFLSKGSIIKNGEGIMIVSYRFDSYSKENAKTFGQAIRKLDIKIEYTSIYEVEKFPFEFNGKKVLASED